MNMQIEIKIENGCIIYDNLLDVELINTIEKETKFKEGEYIVTYERVSNGNIKDVTCSLKQSKQSVTQNISLQSMKMEETRLLCHIARELTEIISKNVQVVKPNLARIAMACILTENTLKKIEELEIMELEEYSNNGWNAKNLTKMLNNSTYLNEERNYYNHSTSNYSSTSSARSRSMHSKPINQQK